MRRPRRPDDNRYTDRDAKLWRKLVKQVQATARDPDGDSTPLHKAAVACARACPPAGHAIRGSVFLDLVLTAQRFGHPDRAAKAARLVELAGQVLAIVDAAPPLGGAPQMHARADLDG